MVTPVTGALVAMKRFRYQHFAPRFGPVRGRDISAIGGTIRGDGAREVFATSSAKGTGRRAVVHDFLPSEILGRDGNRDDSADDIVGEFVECHASARRFISAATIAPTSTFGARSPRRFHSW